MKIARAFPRRASSLITTLLVLTILTVIVLAFLQSMSLERKTAASYANILRAQMAADAGVTEASTLLSQLLLKYPDSATVWVPNMAPNSVTNRMPGTAFFYYDQVSVTNTNVGAPPTLYYRPLVSGVVQTNVTAANRATALSEQNSSSNYVNINATNADGTPPWIGLPPGSSDFPINVPWVTIYSGTNGPAIGRYAFWIEDESFRLNVATATNVARIASSQGTNASEMSIQGGIAGVFSNSDERGLLATNIVALRTNQVFQGNLRNLRNLNYANSAYTNLAERLGFAATIFSSGLNLSRSGARRVNLNAIVATNTPGNSDSERALNIRKELDAIITTIKHEAPSFGKRFYRYPQTATNSPPVTEDHQVIYLNKIAANIRDYIDGDSQPTIVLSGSSVAMAKPTMAIATDFGDDNEVWAVGKENVPRLQESFFHLTQVIRMEPAGTSSPFEIRLSYFFEFWNMGTKDITVADLGPNAFLRVSDQFAWLDASSGSARIPAGPSRDFSIPLADFVDGSSSRNPLVFRAGGITVLTTDPLTGQASGFVPNRDAIFRPKVALNAEPHVYRSGGQNLPQAGGGFQGIATLVSDGRVVPIGSQRPLPPGSAPSNFDAGTDVILGNDRGWIESHNQAVPLQPGIYADSFSNGQNRKMGADFQWRGGVLMGNLRGSGVNGGKFQVGDPRANNEQLKFTEPALASSSSQTRFDTWHSGVSQSDNNQGAPMRSTMGTANTAYVRPDSSDTGSSRWDEGATSLTMNLLANGGGPAVYRNDRMQSIGELGHIYDPVRQGSSAADVEKALGGGRTLRIGQSEAKVANSGQAMWDGNPSSASRGWVAWRLVDFFSVTDEVEAKGLVNPNGALRDNGAALRALVEGFTFGNSNEITDQTLLSKTISSNAVAAFIGSLTNYLANSNNPPLLERGQLSELAFFNTNSIDGVSAANFDQVNDRGREELFRRLVEMVTTRGNTFSIYVVGQALAPLPNGTTKVTATTTKRVVVRLMPQFEEPLTAFDVDNSESVKARFAAATNYVIQIIPQPEN